MLFLLFSLMWITIHAASRQSGEMARVCTPSTLDAEGRRRYKAAHLQGHWFILRECHAISFYDYMEDLSTPEHIRKMDVQEIIQRLETAVDLSSISVQNLRILKFGHCGIGDEHVQGLLRLLKMKQVSTTLQELHLNGNHLTDNGISALLEGFRTTGKFTSLKELHLDRNNIGNMGMKAVVDFVRTERLATYEDLYLADNPAWSINNKNLGEVIKWMPITQTNNRIRHLRGEVRVHIGDPGIIRCLVAAADSSRDAGNGNSNGQDKPREDERNGMERVVSNSKKLQLSGKASSRTSLRDVALAELTLLQRELPGMRSVLPSSHAIFLESNFSTAVTLRNRKKSSEVEMGRWEKESEVVMAVFLQDCLDLHGDTARLKEVTSSLFHDIADFSKHIAALGHRTPSALILLSPEDLQEHLEGSPEVLSKVLLRCTCDYYSEFQHLANVYTRANSLHHITLGDLVDDVELMSLNKDMGPLFDRNKKSVKDAGPRVTNIGTGSPHQSWLPYRHLDHHLPNKERSLHERDTREADLRAKRTLPPGGKLDFRGSAGLYDSYQNRYKNDKWQRDDALWQRSFCSSAYFRKPHGGEATTERSGKDKSERKRKRKSRSKKTQLGDGEL